MFLPSVSVQSTHVPSDHIILPLELPSEAPPLPQNPSVFAARLLMRYAYVLGDSPTIFMSLKSASQGETLLKNADAQKNVALMCINDDLGSGDPARADKLLRTWFQRRWPEKLRCEL